MIVAEDPSGRGGTVAAAGRAPCRRRARCLPSDRQAITPDKEDTMRGLSTMAAGGALIVALWAPAVGGQQSQEQPQAPRGGQLERRGERHPHLRAAMYALMNAERPLSQAAHDYGGPRVKAREL